jgi:hypothetical protein
VQNQVQILAIFPDLAQVVKGWPNLPEHIKAAVKALVKSWDSMK